MQLSKNFALSEFTTSKTATRKGIDNTPSDTVIQNLKTLANGLELVRKVLGYPIFISSGYRCIQLNKAIGGSLTSDHVYGYAADFTCNKFGTPREIVKLIHNSGIKYDQLILEGVSTNNLNGAWVHISFASKMRQQTITAKFKNGKVTYEAFV